MLKVLYIFLLCFCMNNLSMAVKMIPEEINEGLPENYKSLMPVPFLECAKFVSKNKIWKGVKVFRRYYKDSFKEEKSDLFIPENISTYKHFKQTYEECKKYIYDNNLKDQHHSIEEYIYESIISTIWWNYMYDRPDDYR